MFSSTRRSTPRASGPARRTGPRTATPVVDVDRGGLITWHGPGQLVGYPLVALATPLDVVDYVRRLEEALIAVVTGMGSRAPGGWTGAPASGCPRTTAGPERKVAAIGVRVQRGVTMHGFALNCDPDLTWFDRIVPCGITDAGVTSLAVELDRHVPRGRAAGVTATAVADALGRPPARRRAPVRPRARARRPGPAPAPRPAVTEATDLVLGTSDRHADRDRRRSGATGLATRAAAPPRPRSARGAPGRPGRTAAGRSA